MTENDHIYDLLEKHYKMERRVEDLEHDMTEMQNAFNSLVRQLQAPAQPAPTQEK